ncbi:hypothetical protein OQA88_6432 [Cercophora sp. LCS_1]
MTTTETAMSFPDRGPTVFAVTTATSVLATVFVAARMVSRIGIVRSVSWDDYIVVFAWLVSFFLCLSIDFGTKRGLGRHDAHIDPAQKPGLRMCEYIFSVLYNPALMATKTSILVFYLRLARNTQKILRLASWAVLGIVNVAGTILTFMNIFQCRPINAAWDINVTPESCIPLLTEFICSSPVNVITDLAIMALPIPVITGMRLPPRQKTILVITFALGFFVTVVDVVRIYYLQQAIDAPMNPSPDTSAIFGQSPGFSWNASFSLMWSAVEVNVGITCACIPTLKPLIIKILPVMIVDPDGTRRSGSQARSGQLGGDKPTSSDESQPSTSSAINGSVTPTPPAPTATSRQSDEVSIREFLSNGVWGDRPGAASPRPNRLSFPSNPRVVSMTPTVPDRAVYFGFVNMDKPKSMIRCSAAESFRYCTVVSILFFLWGLSYGLLNTLNNVVADLLKMSEAKTLGLTSIYFGGGYFFGPLVVAEWVLRHDEHHRTRRGKHEPDSVGGFKATFITGLLIYGTGTIMIWPAAVLNSYGGFMASSFVIGFGLAVLETAANPFLALCGPPAYADARLLLAQGVQGVGSVLSGLLANNVFFNRIDSRSVDSTTLIDVQWTYLAVTLLSVLLAFFFYYMPLPEVTDAELERLAKRLPVDPAKPLLGGISLKTWAIILAVFCQWTYLAAQENMSLYFQALITAFVPGYDGSNNPPGFPISTLNFLLIAHTAFAVSRFAAGFLAYISVKYPKTPLIPKPRTVLTMSVASAAIFILIAIVMKPTANPTLIAIPIILYYFAEGPIWPLAFSLAIRGQGKRTKRAAAWLTMGGSGPAFWPFVGYAILQSGRSVQTSFFVVLALSAASLVYPIFLHLVKDAKTMVDPSKDGPGRNSGMMIRRGSEGMDTILTVDQIIAARRRDMEKDKRSSGGNFLAKLTKPWGRDNTDVEAQKQQPAAGGQNQEQVLGDLRPGEEPWERQILDTRILQR